MDELQKLEAELQRLQPGTPEREAHIERLRKLVEAGEYHVEAEDLARDLIQKAMDRKP